MHSARIMNPSLPDIYAYSDYRSFLRDYVRTKKEAMRGWSLNVWARQLKIDSRSMLSMILNGGRQPGPDLVERMIAVLALDDEQAAYFDTLVRYEKSKNDPTMREILAARLVELNPRLAEEEPAQLTFTLRRADLAEARQALGRIEATLMRLLSQGDAERAIKLTVDFTLLGDN